MTPKSPFKAHKSKGAAQSPHGDVAGYRVIQADKQRNFMHRGSHLSGAQYFATTVSAPGSMGEKNK